MITRYAQRLVDRIDALPPSIRPAAYGAFAIVLFMLLRGAWIVAPVAIIYVLVTSDAPLHVLALGSMVVGVAMLGGAVSGLAYGLVGRHVQRAFWGGWYLTGIITIAPYMFVLNYIERLTDGRPLLAPLSSEDVAISVGMAIVFGLVMGHSWFGPDKKQAD